MLNRVATPQEAARNPSRGAGQIASDPSRAAMDHVPDQGVAQRSNRTFGKVAPSTEATGPAAHDFSRISVQPNRDSAEHAMPHHVNDVLSSPGQPLARGLRRYFEPRFGTDFGQVKVHDGPAAKATARALEADAYAFGNHVVLGSSDARRASTPHLRTMAHELAHVVQQQGQSVDVAASVSRPGDQAEIEADTAAEQVLAGAEPIIRWHPGAACVSRQDLGAAQSATSQPFYQEALDALASERGLIITLVRSQIIPASVPALEKLVELCRAIDAGAKEKVDSALGAFLAVEAGRLPPATPSTSLLAEMTARMIAMGLSNQADRLRRWGVNREVTTMPSIAGPYADALYAWDAVLDRLKQGIPETGASEGLKALDRLLVFLDQLVRERFSLDAGAIEQDAKRRAAHPDNFFIQRERSISVYAADLARLIHDTYAALQAPFQLVLDQAAADLAGGRGDAFLVAAKDRLETRLRPLIDRADKSQHPGGIPVETTKSEFNKGGGSHHDALANTEAAAAKRSVRINFYDAEQTPWAASEKSSNIAEVFIARRSQIAFLEEFYGVATDEEGKLKDQAVENAAAMASLGPGSVRLHNDDDWRNFVLAKFELRAATHGADDAFVSVINLMRSYMQAFTTHTPYNIEDFGDNHLTKTFPRDLAGRLIHDCGVYALRTAYILSLLRDHPKLQLRFDYVVLPVHVGLLITGKGLSTFLVHNDTITRFTAAQIQAMRGQWDQLNEQGGHGGPARRATDARFSGELMAHAFIGDVDIPYKPIGVASTAGKPMAVKTRLWSQYTRDVAPAADRLFGPSVRDLDSPNYQFHLKYLSLLGLRKKYHNEAIVPLWNYEANSIWDRHKPLIKAASDARQQASPDQAAAAQAAYDAAVDAYEVELQAAMEKVYQAGTEVFRAQFHLQQYIDNHPEIFASGAEVASAARISGMFGALGWSGERWEWALYSHLLELRAGTNLEAPFEKREARISPWN